MKKVLTVFLTLCLLVSLATCFAFSASAEEQDITVTVGQVFEWNDQSKDLQSKIAWSKKNKSPDGLWKYQFYSLTKKIYKDMVYSVAYSAYAWSTNPTQDDSGIGYCRVREFGKNFHPGYAGDTVKVFTCPSGGTIQITNVLSRSTDLVSGTDANGTSFAIYVEDRKVFPENEEYLTLVSTSPQIEELTIDVAKNERIYFHIGAIGDNTEDGVNMTNTITYKTINDDVAEIQSQTDTNSATSSKKPNSGNQNNNNSNNLPVKKDGLPVGAIIGIVAAAVVVVAVVVVIVLKKKKQN